MPPQRRQVAAQVLADSAQRTEQALRNYLDELTDVPARLKEAMGYSLFAGGKRLRPGLVFAAGRMLGAEDEDLVPAAVAIECVHTFSLIHDDLPAMDDDDLRRGKPTSHKVFGEAMAILAGDALLALAFEILARARAGAREMVLELAVATGPAGMIGGQVADMEGEHQPPTEANVRYIHERKTGALIAAACRLGAVAAGGCEADLTALGHYGYHLGLAFQLADDALDATATAEQLGKRAGKDTQAGKQTMVRLAGLEATMQAARQEVEQAAAALEPYGEAAEPLRALAEFVIARSN
jgi:geranylgeranyl diphosphate synthase type II